MPEVMTQGEFDPTPSQRSALDAFTQLLVSREERCVMVVRGPAGTGKSRLIGQFANVAQQNGHLPLLAAPTGRAARVLSERAKPFMASTVHRLLYSFENLEEVMDSSEQPVFHYRLKASEDPGNVVYVIDEASMVSDVEVRDTNLRFGSGKLLSDLLHYVFWAHPGGQRKLLLIGDHCQLPPIDAGESVALDPRYLREQHGCHVIETKLTDVVRQQRDSGIIEAATSLRKMIESNQLHTLTWSPSDQVRLAKTSDEFEQALRSQWATKDAPQIVCFTNARVREWNRWVRERIHRRGEEPVPGDRLLVIRNHGPSGLLNGDLADLIAVSPREERTVRGVTLSFRDVTLAYQAPGGQAVHWSGKLLENLLLSPERTATDHEQQAMWILFKMDHPGLRPGSDEFKTAIMTDPYWNSLFAKFGYAATCHKSQGGEWDEVFVDPETARHGRSRDISMLRWLYTAVTRGKRRLTILSPPAWSAGAGLTTGIDASKRSGLHDPTTGSAGEVGERPHGLEALVFAAVQARNLPTPRLERHAYLLRLVWRDAQLHGKLEVRFGASGQPSGVAWTGESAFSPMITLPELEARWWLEWREPLINDVPAGVKGVMSKCRELASARGLVLKFDSRQYQLRLQFVDPELLLLGPASVTANYNSRGQITGSRVVAIPASLRERVEDILRQAASHD